ncbi:MAG: glutaredoxin [Alphaproteobacteria bacterium PA4]|nr:MAG: glutaredoxin [Alphaproteobacteria bacterium PA4]
MLLRRHGAAFVEYSVSERPELFDAMVERAQGRSTVPQIFIDGVPIGGSDELALLDRCGQLEAMLGTGGNLSA